MFDLGGRAATITGSRHPRNGRQPAIVFGDHRVRQMSYL